MTLSTASKEAKKLALLSPLQRIAIHREVRKAASASAAGPAQRDGFNLVVQIPRDSGRLERDSAVTSIEATQLMADRGDLGSIAEEVDEAEVAFAAFAAFALAAFFELLGAARSSAASSSSITSCQFLPRLNVRSQTQACLTTELCERISKMARDLVLLKNRTKPLGAAEAVFTAENSPCIPIRLGSGSSNTRSHNSSAATASPDQRAHAAAAAAAAVVALAVALAVAVAAAAAAGAEAGFWVTELTTQVMVVERGTPHRSQILELPAAEPKTEISNPSCMPFIRPQKST